jgi:hypothetical protein
MAERGISFPAFPRIQELDINLMVVYEKGAIAFDAGMITSQEGKGEF